MKKINAFIRLISSGFSKEEGRISREEQPERKEPYPSCRYNAGPANDNDLNLRGIDKRAADAARKLWCNTEHF